MTRPKNSTDVIAVVVAVVWLLCSWLTIGMWMGHFQTEFSPSSFKSDLAASILPALAGPMGAIAVASQTGFGESGLCWTKRGCQILSDQFWKADRGYNWK